MATCRCGKRQSKHAVQCTACHQEMLAAAQSEWQAFNLAAAHAARKPTIETVFGPYEVLAVTPAWDYRCRRAGARGAADRTFCDCNDGVWAGLLAQLRVPRHPRWAA